MGKKRKKRKKRVAFQGKTLWTDAELDALGEAIVTEKARYGYSKKSFRKNARYTLSRYGHNPARVRARLRYNLNPRQGTCPYGH
jgi:hypothetical protein